MEEDFLGMLRGCKNGYLTRRLLAFHHLQQGDTIIEAAEKSCSIRNQVQDWLGRYRREGRASFVRQSSSGRPPSLSPVQLHTFKEAFQARQAKLGGGRLTGKDAQDLLEQQVGRRFGLTTVYSWLHHAGLSWITGRDIHPQANLVAQAAFKKTSLKQSRRPSLQG